MKDRLPSDLPLRAGRLTVPCGTLLLGAAGDELLYCDWENGWHRAVVQSRIDRFAGRPFAEVKLESDPLLGEAARQIGEYFEGKRREFRLPVRFVGTDFQRAVWEGIRAIPFGSLVTYGDLARSIGRPAAFRAVGQATGENPFSIIVPCHRVVGSTRTMTGYGGGYAAKKMLLELEGFTVAGEDGGAAIRPRS